jgi:hypothetical protein
LHFGAVDVVLARDGRLLFAYAAGQETITATRRALESVLSNDQIKSEHLHQPLG